MKYSRLTAFAAMLLAGVTSLQAAWVYTETNTVANGVSTGYLTDGTWTFGTERAKNVQLDLTVKANLGESTATTPCVFDFTTIEGGYKVVTFHQFSSQHGGFSSATRGSKLYSYRGLVSEFIAPDCTAVTGEGCFKNCTNLTKVILNENAKIGTGRLFEGCSSLTELYPRRFPSAGNFGFLGCSSLEGRIELYEATSVGSKLFGGCSSLEEIVPPNVTAVGEGGFQNCSSLTNVVLSPQLVKLQDWAFDECTELCEESIRRLLHKGLAQWGNDTTTKIRG